MLEQELFAAVLALPATERHGYLKRACGDDPGLHARVEALVDAVANIENAQPPLSPELAGEQVGDYRLIEEIGEGGCGVVYLAEQAVPVRRHVALKIIKPGMDTREVIARFAAEQQALALMDHPNIAGVFDAGATSRGRPYFVMELVRGIRITQYCEQSHLDIPERLALFSEVCQAIHHAHEKGVIHRDIKPSNVLVTLRERTPVVKVIDFGIAKAMQGRLTELTLSTVLGQFLGTPAYVSPEQTELTGIEVDARSDVYSLGVLLYELLTGCTPIAAGELSQASLDDMRRRIREEEPLSPSRRVGAIVTGPKSGTKPLREAAFLQQVKGDLDWIVMRCLEKDRTRRYQTVNDLVLDLQRYLRHEPVVARPPGAVYAFRKFARRHRALVATGAAIVVVLLITTVLSTWLAVRALQAEQSAGRAEQLARTEAASRQEVIDFLRNDLLAQASPRNEPDRDLKLRDVLDRAAEKIKGRFTDEPQIEASVREVLGSTYGSLGEYTAARLHFERVLAIHRQQFGENDIRTLSAMNNLIPMLRSEGNYAAAESLGARTLQQQRRLLGQSHPDTLATMLELASVYSEQGRIPVAEALQVQAVDQYTRVLGTGHSQTLLAMHELALSYLDQGKFIEAEALLTRTLQALRRMYDADHPEILFAMNSLTVIYGKQGRFSEAEMLQVQTLELFRRVLGPEHPDTLKVMTNLAATYEQQGKYAEAEKLLSQALGGIRRVLGAEHPVTLSAMNNLANIYRKQGRLPEARALQIQTLAAARKVWGSEHPSTLAISRNLAVTQVSQGDLTPAEALLRKGLEVSRRVQGVEHPDTLKYSLELGTLLVRTGRSAEAESLLRSSIAGYEKSAADDWLLFSAKSLMGDALLRQHRFADAEPLILEGYRGLQQRAGTMQASRKADITAAGERILRLYVAWGQSDKASQWRLRLVESRPAP